MASRAGISKGAAAIVAAVALYVIAMSYLAIHAAMIDAGQPPVSGQAESVHVGAAMDHLVDHGGLPTTEAILSESFGARFTPSDGRVPNVGMLYFRNGMLWMRFAIPSLATAETRWTLRIADTRARDAVLLVTKGGATIERRWTFDDPERRAGLGGFMPAFHFERSEIEGGQAILGLSSFAALRGNVFVETRRSYEATVVAHAVVTSLISGMLAVLAVYLLAIGWLMRDGAVALAGAMSSFFAVLIFGGNGLLNAVALPGRQAMADLIVYGTQPASFALWLLFMVAYLKLRERNPRLFAVLVFLALLLPFQGILVTLKYGLGWPIPIEMDTSVPFLAGILAGFATLIVYAVKGDRRARNFLICWAPFGAGTAFRLYAYLVPSSGLTSPWAQRVTVDLVVSILALAILMVLDIQRREARLRREAQAGERRFRDYAEIASDSFFETDGSGRLLTVAGPLSRQIGLTPGTALPDWVGSLTGSGEPAARVGEVIGARGSLRDLELKAGEGTAARWLALSLSPGRTDALDGAAMRGTLSDITERARRRESERRQSALVALGQLAGGLAHEMNNLLHPIVNLARRVRDKGTVDDQSRELLDIVVRSGTHAGEIVGSVLNSFNPARLPGEAAPFHRSLAIALETARSMAGARIRIVQTLEEIEGIVASPGEVLQVVSNLMSNAVRAIDGGGRSPSRRGHFRRAAAFWFLLTTGAA